MFVKGKLQTSEYGSAPAKGVKLLPWPTLFHGKKYTLISEMDFLNSVLSLSNYQHLQNCFYTQKYPLRSYETNLKNLIMLYKCKLLPVDSRNKS